MENLSDEEKTEMRVLLSKLYGNQALSWGITIRSYELLGELISKTKQCDGAMSWVPRPFYVGNALNWAKRQVRQAIVRYFNKDESRHYLLCMNGAALAMKSRFFMAQY